MTEERVCLTCGRALPGWRKKRECTRCENRRLHGVETAGRPLCVSKGCGNIARANQGLLCIQHAIPALLTHSEPGPMATPCEVIDGQKDEHDYGHAMLGARQQAAHRWIWQVYVGPIPEGMFVCHRCDRPGCVALDHLFLGTPTDNVRDMLSKGRARPPRMIGERSGTWGVRPPGAKLTDEQVAEIRAAVGAGELNYVVAARYGVHRTTIDKIIRGERYVRRLPAPGGAPSDARPTGTARPGSTPDTL